MVESISEAVIRQYATDESFRRGEEYYRNGAVVSAWRRGDLLQAAVEGSEPEPYLIRITLDGGGVAGAFCSCPYDWGGWCKHIVATLLLCLRQPEQIDERRPLAAVLADLDREQIQTILLHLVERDPFLAEVIEREAASGKTAPTREAEGRHREKSGPERRAGVDTRDVRRQVRDALHGLDYMRASEAYWYVGGVVGDVDSVLEQAWAFVRTGDGRSALAVLEAITDEYVRGWTDLDDSEGELSDFFGRLGAAWSEALLTADLTREERESWVERLEDWANEVEDYGVDDAFDGPITAAREGWDDPAVRAMLRGEATTDDERAEGDPADARLNVLERQGRFEELLNLARATGRDQRYATMLARLGRTREAVRFGLEQLTTAEDALALARALRERDQIEDAARIGEHGLTLEGPKGSLAEWLRDLAAGAGMRELALRAAVIAFQESPNLPSYLRVEELAGADWLGYRAPLLDRLRKIRTYYPAGPLEVLLHEKDIDGAIAVVEESASPDLIEQVAVAAIEARPEWVIRTCRREAEAIMDAGKSQYYDRAAQWLAHAASAYRADGRTGEFQGYLSELIARHARKYRLVPLLQKLKAA